MEEARGPLSGVFDRILGVTPEVAFPVFWRSLPPIDKNNLKKLFVWLLPLVGNDGEVLVVGSTVRALLRGGRAEGRDIDIRVLAHISNREMARKIEGGLGHFPVEFSVDMEDRWDHDSRIQYCTFKLFPRAGGRPIHLLPPRPSEMTPEDHRRQGRLAEGPYCLVRERDFWKYN